MIGNMVAYGFILLVSLVLAVTVQEYYTLAALIVILIMPLILVSVNIIASRFVKGEMKKDAFRHIVGDKVQVSIALTNGSIIPFQKIRLVLEVEDSMGMKNKHQICTNLSALEEKEVVIHFESETAIG